jgi:AAA+ ATPase superfamily predicted ATPase
VIISKVKVIKYVFGRKSELKFLLDRYKKEGAEFIILHRRRIGKAELVRKNKQPYVLKLSHMTSKIRNS